MPPKSAPQTFDHLFRIEFDPSSGLNPTWIDTKTLNYFNSLRDNIFASSGLYDMAATASDRLSKSKSKKSKGSSSKTASTTAPVSEFDKNSVAFQRGKRSCTITDLPSTRKPVTPPPALKPPPEMKVPLTNDTQYDFCHHCKQLKNKYLLVSCKYSAKKSMALTGPSEQGPFTYIPYPYEPSAYYVNGVKIHNMDF